MKQNVIDPLADGKSYGPRQAVALLKSIIPSSPISAEMGEERQEFSRIVTDMSGQLVDNSKGPAAIGMEQVQYQSGSSLGFLDSSDHSFGGFARFDIEMNNGQVAMNVPAPSLPDGMQSTVGFEPFDLESWCANMEDPFGSIMQ